MKFAPVVLLMVLLACNDNGKPLPAGGPCTYSTSPFRFTIVAVERDSAYSAIVVPEGSHSSVSYLPDSLFFVKIKLCCDLMYRDTLYLHELTDAAIRVADTKQYGLKEGSVIEGTVDRIVTGTCQSEIYKFNLPVLQ